jgi:hypothetical protein
VLLPLASFLGSLYYTITHPNYLLPGGFILILVLLFIPVGYYPTHEERYYAKHRDDYHDVVVWVQNSIYDGEVEPGKVLLPLSYRHLSMWNTVYVQVDDDTDIVYEVEFQVPDGFYKLVYAYPNQPFVCTYDGFTITKLEDKWFVCYQEWN